MSFVSRAFNNSQIMRPWSWKLSGLRAQPSSPYSSSALSYGRYCRFPLRTTRKAFAIWPMCSLIENDSVNALYQKAMGYGKTLTPDHPNYPSLVKSTHLPQNRSLAEEHVSSVFPSLSYHHYPSSGSYNTRLGDISASQGHQSFPIDGGVLIHRPLTLPAAIPQH